MNMEETKEAEKNPLDVIKKLDEDIFNSIKNLEELAFSDGEIPIKYKILMAMAIDAVLGADEGVRSLVKAAIDVGASRKEIAEAVRVAYYIGGAGSLYTAAKGLKGLKNLGNL
jgi:alkylhydroperoxidase/carboxymuconolactone decarboxylase family protein YurZ